MSHKREPLVPHYLSISLLSTDTVTLLTRLQSRWLFDYFQKSDSLTKAEEDGHPPQLSVGGIPGRWAKHTT